MTPPLTSAPRFARLHAVFDGGRREMRLFGALAVLLVLVRSAAFLVWGHIDFDSDQAIVGLMAKHLSEGRAFPLFFYGQHYMLGVQSWIAAPFFLIARPSVALLKTPLVVLNIVAALLLMRGLSRGVGLRPAVAFVAALPFIMPTPVVAGSFLQTLGSSGVEPILYALFLWMLRARPFAFGALLVFGFLHREFTMYAVPALLVVHAADRSLWTAGAPRWLMRMAAGFGLTWLIIDGLKLYLDGGSLLLQAQMLGRHACVEVAELPGRFLRAVQFALPILSGGRTMALYTYAMRSSAVVGGHLIAWVAGGAVVFMAVRLAWLWRGRRGASPIGYAAYLALAGGCALGGYALTCSFAYPITRYFNMALLLPIGCVAAFMAWEPSALLKRAAVAIVLLSAGANLVDNVRVIREASVNPQPNPHRELTDFLLRNQIRYARAGYWDAYVVDFLSRERVIVGSDGPTRIPEYERLVDANRETAVRIERMPCEGSMQVAAWCIQRPTRPPE